jgi:hypothetical protein
MVIRRVRSPRFGMAAARVRKVHKCVVTHRGSGSHSHPAYNSFAYSIHHTQGAHRPQKAAGQPVLILPSERLHLDATRGEPPHRTPGPEHLTKARSEASEARTSLKPGIIPVASAIRILPSSIVLTPPQLFPHNHTHQDRRVESYPTLEPFGLYMAPEPFSITLHRPQPPLAVSHLAAFLHLRS